ncbi:MAG: RNA 2',3'-cyclic phosphodiesterase [Anaerolineae bacterium]|nr:RNA 2',3'-cyclic phosphodiesterase [Anaerolineae bacterium]
MDTVRLFIAIELDQEILQRIGKLQARLKDDTPPGLVRWVRPEGIHLTLKFLGEVPTERVEAISQATRSACAPHTPLSLAIGTLGCFPNPRRPRVIWVGVDEPTGALARLQRDVERTLKPLGYPPEGRAFSPHLTLGRVKGGGPDALEELGAYVSRASVQVGEMRATSVSLIRSALLPGGAVYTELGVYVLPEG